MPLSRSLADFDDEEEELEEDDEEEAGEDLEDEDDEVSDDDTEFLTPERTVEILARAIAEGASFTRGNQIVVPTGEMSCRVCGCSDNRACPGGCVWIAPNLCSRCTT